MKLRVANPPDAAAIAGLHAESWRQAYRGMLRDDYLDREIYAERTALWEARFRESPDNQYVIVAGEGGQMVGFACTYGNDDAEWGSFLDNLHVAPEYKRRGIGLALMTETAAWCRQHYPQAGMYLWVLASNAAAMRFYEALRGVKSGEGTWTPPDGGEYLKYRYAWRPGLAGLADGTA